MINKEYSRYIYPDPDFEQTPKEVDKLFNSERDAIFALYEQLFSTANSICNETILDSMKYLIFSKEMTNQMDEIKCMQRDDVCVIHHREVENKVEEAKLNLKKELFTILEDNLL